MIIDDDFLPQELVEKIQQEMLHGETPWVLTKELISKDYRFNTNFDPYRGSQFNHLFFIAHKQLSPHWDMVLDTFKFFCDKNNIMPWAITRAKANLTFPDPHINSQHTEAPHTDHSWPHYVFLYYINDSDGDTILYNEKFDDNKEVVLTEQARVSPKAGRAILFDGLHYHSPLTPTKNYRAVINLTFVG